MRLFRYLGRRFLLTFLGVALAFFLILVLIDMVEQIRRLGSDGTVGDAVRLALLNSPAGFYEILPLVVLLGAVALFLALARTSELVIVRAVGVPVFRALSPPITGALLLGVLAVSVLNPIVAGTSRKYTALLNERQSQEVNTISVSQEAIWLRQGSRTGQWVIRADRANPDATELFNATFVGFGPDGTPHRRIEAEHAVLQRGRWEMTGVKDWPLVSPNPERDAVERESLDLPSNLTRQDLEDSIEEPTAISFWDLPDYIRRLERAGFSARRHQVWMQVELASPLFLAAMVMLAAGFTMRHARLGKTGARVLSAVLCGFALFFLRNFAQILGENGHIPAILAGWGPPVVGVLLSAGLILHMEEG